MNRIVQQLAQDDQLRAHIAHRCHEFVCTHYQLTVEPSSVYNWCARSIGGASRVRLQTRRLFDAQLHRLLINRPVYSLNELLSQLIAQRYSPEELREILSANYGKLIERLLLHWMHTTCQWTLYTQLPCFPSAFLSGKVDALVCNPPLTLCDIVTVSGRRLLRSTHKSSAFIVEIKSKYATSLTYSRYVDPRHWLQIQLYMHALQVQHTLYVEWSVIGCTWRYMRLDHTFCEHILQLLSHNLHHVQHVMRECFTGLTPNVHSNSNVEYASANTFFESQQRNSVALFTYLFEDPLIASQLHSSIHYHEHVNEDALNTLFQGHWHNVYTQLNKMYFI